MTMAKKPKHQVLLVPRDDYLFLEGLAKRRRVLAGGTTRPTWGDIVRDLVKKLREAHNKPPEAS